MSNADFEKWPSDLHADFNQVKRIVSAQEKKLARSVVSVSKHPARIVIQGSGKDPYVATLTECTCPDFGHRHLPCKHIYRLAMELDLLNLPHYNAAASGFSKERELEAYKIGRASCRERV